MERGAVKAATPTEVDAVVLLAPQEFNALQGNAEKLGLVAGLCVLSKTDAAGFVEHCSGADNMCTKLIFCVFYF